MESVTGIFSSLTVLPIDWFVLAGIVIVAALDSLRSGIGRATSLSVALLLAFALYSLIGQTAVLGSLEFLNGAMAQAGLFGVLVVALYFLVRRMGFDFLGGGMGEPIQALLAGFATAVVFVCVWLQIPILNEWWTFSSALQSIFSESYRLFWLLAAYAVLAFARG